ncbi:hypothetical protein HDU96_010729, partial [Phlyctochytrium bullatum]
MDGFDVEWSVLVVGLNTTNAGQTWGADPDGCGKSLAVGDAVIFLNSSYTDDAGLTHHWASIRLSSNHDVADVVKFIGHVSDPVDNFQRIYAGNDVFNRELLDLLCAKFTMYSPQTP